MIISQTPFRISFLGGGTDWPEFFQDQAGMVLGSAIDKFIYHSVNHFPSSLFDYSLRLAYRKVECVQSLEEVDHRPFREILRSFSIYRDIEVNLAADLPTFAGLGTSSAFTVGLINALAAFQGNFLSKEELAYRAIAMERHQLAEPVGCQDQVFAAFGGLNLIEFRRTDDIIVNRLTMRRDRLEELDNSLIMVYTGLKRKAAEVESDKIGRIAQTRMHLLTMLRQVERGHAILTGSGPLSSFGELLDEAWHAKQALSPHVSNAQINQLYERARAAGCLGGKLLGAGGGGFILLYAPPDRQAKIRQALADQYEVEFRLNAPGSTIVHSAGAGQKKPQTPPAS